MVKRGGIPNEPTPLQPTERSDAALPSSYQTVPLEEPFVLAQFVHILFDNWLDWSKAVNILLPHLSRPAQFKVAQQLQEDERVTDAIAKYVQELSVSNPLNAACLVHRAIQYSEDDGKTGAVQSTAMNILGKALITEQSEQKHTLIRVEGMEDMRKGFGGETEEKPEDEKLTVN